MPVLNRQHNKSSLADAARRCLKRYASSCERTMWRSVLIPTGEQIVKLQSFLADEPVGALNLVHMYK